MRTVSLVALLFAGALSKISSVHEFLQSQKLLGDAPTYAYTKAPIPLTATTACESCIRGGGDYCIWRTFPNDTTHGQFSNCTNGSFNPEVNSVTNVNETTRWACSKGFKDEMNSIINMCYPYADEKRNEALCGPYDIDLHTNMTNATQTITALPLYTSCTYRLHTTCGYPAIIYSSAQNITDEFDIAYMTLDKLGTTYDIDTWNFNWTSSQFGSTNTTSAVASTLTQTGDYLPNANVTCDSIDRNMWVTITRIADPPAPAPNATFFEARQLAAGSDISIQFISTIGQSFGSVLATSVGILVCALSIFAF